MLYYTHNTKWMKEGDSIATEQLYISNTLRHYARHKQAQQHNARWAPNISRRSTSMLHKIIPRQRPKVLHVKQRAQQAFHFKRINNSALNQQDDLNATSLLRKDLLRPDAKALFNLQWMDTARNNESAIKSFFWFFSLKWNAYWSAKQSALSTSIIIRYNNNINIRNTTYYSYLIII